MEIQFSLNMIYNWRLFQRYLAGVGVFGSRIQNRSVPLGSAVPDINGYTALVYHSDRVIQ